METATFDQATKVLSVFRDEPREQVQAVLESGLLADLRDANFNEPIDRDAVRRLLGLKPLNPPLLEEIGTVVVPAMDSPFVARDNFFVPRQARVSPLCVWLDSNFQEWFLEKTEEPAARTELCCARLTRSLGGWSPILAELGDKVKTTLAQVFVLMERQANGEEGVLLTDGRCNVFYVLDTNGALRAVLVHWYGDGWTIVAETVEDQSEQNDECRVFSRNS